MKRKLKSKKNTAISYETTDTEADGYTSLQPPCQPTKRVTGGKRLHYEGSALEEPPHYNTANVNGN